MEIKKYPSKFKTHPNLINLLEKFSFLSYNKTMLVKLIQIKE